MDYTVPTIVTSDDLSKRSYITFYLNGIRVREYNGNALGLRISPNRADSVIKRDEQLEKLRYEYHKALDSNTYKVEKTTSDISRLDPPVSKSNIESKQYKPITELLHDALEDKLQSSLSRTYKRDLQKVHDEFIAFLTELERQEPLTKLSTSRVQKFLSQFASSGTYYMNKRRNLSVLFNAASTIEDLQLKTIRVTSKRKIKAKLHEKYEPEQLKPILDFLKANYPNLYICCLLTYSSWLRPHEEIRLLTPADFRKGLSEVHLTGAENKGGQVRVVHIPEYAREDISKLMVGLKREYNLFSRSIEPYNECYFNTQWSRACVKMNELKLLLPNQTIYSFRHTAAVQVYRKTKDVYLLQKLLGHSTIVVTLKYLRTLGEVNSEELKEAAPTL